MLDNTIHGGLPIQGGGFNIPKSKPKEAMVKDPSDSFVQTREGVSIADRFYESANIISNPAVQKKAFEVGFDAIMDSDKTSKDEKALAGFGKELGAHPGVFLKGPYAATAEGIVMQTLTGAFFGPIGHRLANVFMRAVDAAPDKDKKNSILSEGFKALQANPLGTAEEKTEAAKGSKAMQPTVSSDKAFKEGTWIMTGIKKDAEFFGWAD